MTAYMPKDKLDKSDVISSKPKQPKPKSQKTEDRVISAIEGITATIEKVNGQLENLAGKEGMSKELSAVLKGLMQTQADIAKGFSELAVEISRAKAPRVEIDLSGLREDVRKAIEAMKKEEPGEQAEGFEGEVTQRDVNGFIKKITFVKTPSNPTIN